MTPQEKELIQGVFQRIGQAAPTSKDSEAEQLIRQSAASQPDALYRLVQAVIVQEMGLNQAQQRIADLQRQLDQAKPAGSSSGGGFLGGGSPWGGGSVPRTVAAPPPSWGQPPASYAPPPPSPPSPPSYAQPSYAPPAGGPWSGGGAGGFLRSAATMAAGVAGGTLIAEGLSNLFGGHHGGFGGGGFGGGGFASGSPWSSPPTEVVENITNVTNYYDDRPAGRDVADVNDPGYDTDPGYQDASYDDGSYDPDGYDDSQDI